VRKTRCAYCDRAIELTELRGFGKYWLDGPETREGAAICPRRYDDLHSPEIDKEYG